MFLSWKIFVLEPPSLPVPLYFAQFIMEKEKITEDRLKKFPDVNFHARNDLKGDPYHLRGEKLSPCLRAVVDEIPSM